MSNENKQLPPDPEGMNDKRAQWAHQALENFGEATGLSMIHEKECVVTDLLCDLRHWCDRNEVDFEGSLRMAEMHYEAETNPDHPDCFPVDEGEVES